MPFDPDAYLKGTTPPAGFDPDAYLGTPKTGMGDVQAAPSAQVPREPTFMDKLKAVGAGMLPATKSPIGALADLVSGGRYGKVAPRYDALSPPPGERPKNRPISEIDPETLDHALSVVMLVGAQGKSHGTPLIEKTPAARYLEGKGVTDLTLGQQAPRSLLGQAEAVSADSPFGLRGAREAGKESWRGAVRREPLGADKAPLPAESDAAMGEAYDRFRPEYDAVRGEPIDPASVAGMPEKAMKLPGGVDARTAAGVANEVGNALTVLPGVEWHPPGMHGGPGHLDAPGLKPQEPRPIAVTREVQGAAAAHDPNGTSLGAGEPGVSPDGTIRDPQFRRSRVYPDTNRPRPASETGYRVAFEEPPPRPEMKAGDLMKVRQVIRDQKTAARQAQDFDRLRLLEHAEDVVTGTIEESLSPDAAAALKDTDRRYAIYNTIEDAANRAGLEGNFSPKQLGAAVRKSAGRRSFVHGGGGELREMAEAGDESFTDVPMTGVRGAIMSAIPFGDKLAAPVARVANLGPVKRFLTEAPVLPGGMTLETIMSDPVKAEALGEMLRRRAAALGAPPAPRASQEDR